MRLLKSFFILFVCTAGLYSQKYKVSGVIKDSTLKEPLVGVNILITNLRDSTKRGGYTDKNGLFELNDFAAGKCKMRISHIGYKNTEKYFEIRNRDIFFREIFLAEDTIILGEVQSTEKMPVVERVGDTINYNAKAFKTEEGAMAEDLIKKLPGIKIDNRSGKIKAENEDVKKVLVDGKSFFGNDVNAARKNIPASLISTVQVYNEESEQAQLTGVSSGETIKVINLITKFRRGLSEGVFGKISGSYGTDNKNLLGGSMNIFDSSKRITAIAMTNNMNLNNFTDDERATEQLQNARSNQDGRIIGMGLNYSNSDAAPLQFSGNYNFTSNKENILSSSNKYYYPVNNMIRNYFEENTSISRYNNHRIGFKLSNLKKSSFQFSLSPLLTIRNNDLDNNMLSNSFINDVKINQIKSNSKNEGDYISFRSDLILNQKLSDEGRNISLGLNCNLNNNDDTKNWENSSIFYEESLLNRINNLSSIFNRDESLFSANLLYTEPIAQFHALQFGYTPSYEIKESDKKGYNFIDNNLLLDSLTTNFQTTKYWTHKIGGLYSYNDREWQITTGLYFNRSSYSGNKENITGFNNEKAFNNIITSIRLSYFQMNAGRYSLSYNTRVQLPSIENMQNVLNNSNSMQLSIGNPDLKEAYIHTIMLISSFGSVNKAGNFNIRGNAALINNYCARNTIVAFSDTLVFDNIFLKKGAQITKPINLDNQLNLSLSFDLMKNLEFMSSELYFSLRYRYNKIPRGYNNKIDYSKNDSKGFEISFRDNRNLGFEYLLEFDYNNIKSSMGGLTLSNYAYDEISATLFFRFKIWNGISLHSDSRYIYTTKGSSLEDRDNILMNLNLSRKFFENSTEFSFTAYDIFNNRKEIQKNITEFFVEERHSQLPRRCYLMTISYHFGKFK